jgi:hypothetical protein
MKTTEERKAFVNGVIFATTFSRQVSHEQFIDSVAELLLAWGDKTDADIKRRAHEWCEEVVRVTGPVVEEPGQ